jgi:phage-related protein
MFQILYYTKDDHNPILEFLTSIPKKDTAKILREIDLLEEFGLSLGMPHIKKLVDSDSLWELRVQYSNNSYRIFYFTLENSCFLMLHAFQKKTDKTPKREIQTALSRKTDYLTRR